MARLASSIRRVSDSEGSILLDLGQGTMFRLNSLGSQILDRLERGESLPRIVTEISTQFAIETAVVRADLEELLASLESHGLLTVNSSNDTASNGR